MNAARASGCPHTPASRLEGTTEDFITNLKKPKISADAAIEVFYTETPVANPGEAFYKLQPGQVNKQYVAVPNVNHTGVGFRVIQRGKENMEFVFNLRVTDFMPYVLLPRIGENAAGFQDLEWCDHVLLTYIPKLDRTYWLKSDYICTIARDDFYALIDWIQGDYSKRRSMYIITSVIRRVTRESIFNPVRKSYLCDDFCYDVYRFLQRERNIAIQYTTVPNYNIAAFVVGDSPVQELDMRRPENQELVFNYYSNVSKIFKDIVDAAAALLSKNSAAAEAALSNLKKDLSIVLGTSVQKQLDELVSALLTLGADVMQILSDLKIESIDPNDKSAKNLRKALDVFNADKTYDNLYLLFKAYVEYETINPTLGTDVIKLKADFNALKKLFGTIMASSAVIIYYGYTDDYSKLTYFLIKGPVGFYANYLETDLMRDRPFYNIYGKLVTDDPYTKINMNRRLIHNYVPSNPVPWFVVLGAIIFVLVVLVLILLFKRRRGPSTLGPSTLGPSTLGIQQY